MESDCAIGPEKAGFPMSHELIAYYRSITEADGIDKAREAFHADVSKINQTILDARTMAGRRDWNKSQREQYVEAAINAAEIKLSKLRPIGRAYLSIN